MKFLLLVIALVALAGADDCDDDDCTGGAGGALDFDVVSTDFGDSDLDQDFDSGVALFSGDVGFAGSDLSGGGFRFADAAISARGGLGFVGAAGPGVVPVGLGGGPFVEAGGLDFVGGQGLEGIAFGAVAPTPNFAGRGLAARFFNVAPTIPASFNGANFISRGSSFVGGNSFIGGGGLRSFGVVGNRLAGSPCRFGAGLVNSNGYSSCVYPYHAYRYFPRYYRSYSPSYYRSSYQFPTFNFVRGFHRQPYYRYSDVYHRLTNNYNYHQPEYRYFRTFPSYSYSRTYPTSGVYHSGTTHGGYRSSVRQLGSGVGGFRSILNGYSGSRNGFLRGYGSLGGSSRFGNIGYGGNYLSNALRGVGRSYRQRYGNTIGYGQGLGYTYSQGLGSGLRGAVGSRSGSLYGRSVDYASVPNYSYTYATSDPYSRVDNSKSESRYGDRTDGSYSVNLPDGRTQVVNYWVNGDSGFNADVQYYGTAQHPKRASGYSSSGYSSSSYD